MELGTVISTIDSPTTNKFSFVISNLAVVRKARFVQLTTEEGTLLGVVQDIVRANRYFERAESVSEYEKNSKKPAFNSSFHENFPAAEWEFAVAECAVLGAYDTNLRRASFPAAPGAKVHDADLKLLKDFFAFEDSGLNIGRLLVHDLEVKLSMNKLFQKHLAILGISGSGKCLPFNTPVFLSDGSIKKIGELADYYFKKGKSNFEDGVEIVPVNELVEVLCLDKNLRLATSKISKFTRRKSPAKLLKITTNLGREVTLTLEHPVLSPSDFCLEWKEAGTIKENEYIAIPRQAAFGNLSKISLTEYYKNSEEMRTADAAATRLLKGEIRKIGTLNDFAKRLDADKRDLAYWLNSGNMPMKKFIEAAGLLNQQELAQRIRYIKLEGAQNAIPAKLLLTYDLGRVIGLLMGDGHVGEGILRFSNLDLSLKKSFAKSLSDIFGLAPKITEKEAVIGSETLAKVAREIFGVEPKSALKNASETILCSNPDFLRGFLSGLLDADGTVSKTTPQIGYCSASHKLAVNVSNLLLRFGIISSLKPKFDKTYKRYYYNIFIYGRTNLSLYGDNIGFAKEEKQQLLNAWKPLKPNPNLDVIPNIHKLIETCCTNLNTTPSEICRRAGFSEVIVATAKLKYDTLGRETLSKIASVILERKIELENAIKKVNSLEVPASVNIDNSIGIIRRIYYNNPLEYKEIAKGCGISGTTVGRMPTGRTQATENVFELSKGILSSPLPEEDAKEIHNVMENICTANEISTNFHFQLSRELGCPLDKLSRFSGLWEGACGEFNRGERNPTAVQKISMLEGLKKAAKEVQEQLKIASALISHLENLTSSSIFWDRIKAIAEVPSESEYVYDLEVENNHNFLAGTSPVILHNSVTTAVMIEELLSRSKERGRLAAVIFDAHGEYVSFSDKRHNPEFADKATVINASKVQIAAKNLSPGLISKLLPGISHTQMRDLAPILSKMKKDGREKNEVFGLEQIVQNVQASDMKENVKDALLSWLFELRNLKIVGEHDAPFLKKTIKPGMLTVFDLSSIVNMLKKQIIVSYISEKMFALRRKEELPPYVMIVEEAHNFAPEKAEKKYAISKGIINTVAREGRKFGASLCLISQRPVQLSTTALSQMNTMLIMRITNPYDLKHIAESAEAIDANTQNQISSLRVGEGVLIGEAVNYPVFVRVRNRKTKKISKGESLEELAKRFEEKLSLADAIADADVQEAFL